MFDVIYNANLSLLATALVFAAVALILYRNRLVLVPASSTQRSRVTFVARERRIRDATAFVDADHLVAVAMAIMVSPLVFLRILFVNRRVSGMVSDCTIVLRTARKFFAH